MPEKENLFSQAENDRYNVSNVLSDAAFSKKNSSVLPNLQEEEAEINLEEGAPFLESIDPDATIGEYMERYEEEEAALAQEEEAQVTDAPEVDSVAAMNEPDDETIEGVQSSAIREQAEKARASFMDDLQSLGEEPGIRNNTIDETDYETVNDGVFASDQQTTIENEEDDDGPDPITLKDLVKPAARRIKKPRFVQAQTTEQSSHTDESEINTDVLEPETDETIADDIVQTPPTAEPSADAAAPLNDELAEARAAQKKGQSICEDLHHLQKLLEEGRSPIMHKTEVLVPREKTLRLIRSLTAICDVDPSYIDCASEDKLIDRLVSEHTDDDYRPLERARNRAQTIIQNATKQADTILNDAKTLARQLLAETEAEIKEKFDEADEQIAVRMTTTKEESTKKLNEARSELTSSRQRSVEILSKYLEKAENDYQGYWERAENTVMASLEQSESILGKAADIYQKELATIRQDKEELDEILHHLKKYNKPRFGK
ncbi:MAG: hypothetical protein UDG94_02940 [Peptococcaceae bacterium]|nr:hypothetical protein [Peptococcaceae bacterium]